MAAELSLSELTAVIKNENQKNTQEIQDLENTVQRGDKGIVDSLNKIYSVLMQQLNFDREKDNRERLEAHLKPREFQQDLVAETATKEKESEGDGGLGLLGGLGVLKLFWDSLKGLINILKSVGGALMEFAGLKKVFDTFKVGLGSIAPKIMELLGVVGPLALRFGAIGSVIAGLLVVLEKFGSWFRDLVGLPSMQNDAFNMKNYTGENFQSNKPMTQEEFEQNRIPKTVGGESARKVDKSAAEQPMTVEKMMESRSPKTKDKMEVKGKTSGVADYLQETDASNLQKTMGISKEQYDVFRGSVAKIESPSYSKKGGSSGRFSGAYQMGADEIRESAKALGISAPTREEFLNNPQLQEKLFDKYTEGHHKQLMKNEKYAAMSKEEQLKVLGYAHNQGAGGASKWLKTGVVGKDAFGTAGTKYYESIGKNLSALEKGDIKINYADKETPIKMTSTDESGETATKVSTSNSENSKEQKQNSGETYKDAYNLLQERTSSSKDIKNIDADYAVNVSNFIKDAEKTFGEKVTVSSGYRAPTKEIKEQLGSVGSDQKTLYDNAKDKSMVAKPYHSMHDTGLAMDLSLGGRTLGKGGTMNKMSKEMQTQWKELAQKHNLDLPMTPGGKASGVTEWWHVEPKDIKRGGSSAYGLEGEKYKDYISGRSIENAAKSGKTSVAAVYDNKLSPTEEKEKNSYAKLEKELPEGKGYAEEESEMEEMDEPVLSDNLSTSKDNLTTSKDNLTTNRSDNLTTSKDNLTTNRSDNLTTNRSDDFSYKNYFEDMITNLEKMVSFTEENKDSKQNETKFAKSEKEFPEGKGYDEEESEMEKTNESTLSEDSDNDKEYNKIHQLIEKGKEKALSGDMNAAKVYEDTARRQLEKFKSSSTASKDTGSEEGKEISKEEQTLTQEKSDQLSNLGVTGFGSQNPFGAISQGMNQNPFGAIQGALGSIGSVVSMGQNMKNMGSMGGAYGVQGALGGIQGVMGSLGMQSPVLAQVGQAMGSIGNVMSSVQTAKNMGSMGGGLLGGINAASAGIGAAGSIFNTGKNILGGIGSTFGEDNKTPQTVSQENKKGFFESVGDNISSFFGGDKNSIATKGIDEDTKTINEKYLNQDISASLMPSPSTDGFSLEGMSKDVAAGKEEIMTPPADGGSPTIINSGGGSGGAGGGGGGNSQSNPSSAGVMGIDIGVRNEEATLLRAQFGSVRIV